MRDFFQSKLNIFLSIALVAVIGVGVYFGLDFLKKPDVVVPDFSKYTSADILAWAEENKVSDKLNIEYEYDELIPNGEVIYQSVKEGDIVGERITIIISKGEDPDSFIEIAYNEASSYETMKLWFSEYGFNDVVYKYQKVEDMKDGQIISVEPAKAKKTDQITVYIAGDEMFEVISLDGYTKEEVDAWATKNNLKVIYKYESSETIEKGKVLKQSPRAGELIAEKGSITVTLSQGNIPTATIPDNLLGMEEEKFKKTLDDLGFKNLKKAEKTYFSVSSKKGTIFSYDDGNLPLADTINYAISEGQYTFVDTDYNDKSLTSVQSAIKELNARNAHITLKTTEVESTEVTKGNLFECSYSYERPNTTISCKLSKPDSSSANDDTEVYIDEYGYLGKTETEFLDVLKKLGFKNFEKLDSVTSERYAKDTICYYLPDGKQKLSATIKYKVSLGKTSDQNKPTNAYISENGYLGKTETEFLDALKKLGFTKFEKLDGITSEKYAKDTICYYLPDGNQSTDTTIKYKLSLGKASEQGKDTACIDPNGYLGKTETQFLDALKALGFTKFEKLAAVTSEKYAKDTICYYLPDGNQSKSQTIKYKLSLGKASEQTPSSPETPQTPQTPETPQTPATPTKATINSSTYKGKTETEFTTALKALGFNNLSKQTAYSETVEKGKVISYTPTGEVEFTQTVTYVVSLGSEYKDVTLLGSNAIDSTCAATSYDAAATKVKNFLKELGFADNKIVITGEKSADADTGRITSVKVDGQAHTTSKIVNTSSTITVVISTGLLQS